MLISSASGFSEELLSFGTSLVNTRRENKSMECCKYGSQRLNLQSCIHSDNLQIDMEKEIVYRLSLRKVYPAILTRHSGKKEPRRSFCKRLTGSPVMPKKTLNIHWNVMWTIRFSLKKHRYGIPTADSPKAWYMASEAKT